MLFSKENNTKYFTVTHYKICFKTIDNKEHVYSKSKYIDEQMINCSPLEFFLAGEKYLKDDDGIMYPINNVLSIWAMKDKEAKAIEDRYREYHILYGENEVIKMNDDMWEK